jgi:ABC-type Fe3+-siderophore transport system permease subunit
MVVNKKEILKGNKEEGLHFKEPLKKFGLFVIQPFQIFLAICTFLLVYFFAKIHELNIYSNYLYLFIIITYLIFGFLHFLLTKKKKFYYIDRNFSIVFLLFQIANPLHRNANENLAAFIVLNSLILFVFVAFIRFYYLEMKSFKHKNQFLFQ